MVIVLIQKIKQIIHEIEFKRADGIFGNDWEIFQGKLECEDIKQGNLGNCYLLSAINAIVAKDPMLIYQIFRTNKNSQKFSFYESFVINRNFTKFFRNVVIHKS